MKDEKSPPQDFDSSAALEKLLEVGQSLVAPQDLDSLLQTVAKSASSALGADVVVLYEYREDVDDVKVPPVVWGDVQHPDILRDRNGVRPHRESAVFKMLGKRRKKPFYAPNAKRDWARLMGEEPKKKGKSGDFLTREGIASSAAVRLKADGERVGVLFVNYRTPHAFRDEEQKIIELFATQAAVAIRNARLRADLERQVERLQTLNQVSRELSAELDSASIYEAVVKAAVHTLDCTHCTFFALENDLLVPRASHSRHGDKVTRRFALGEGLAGKAAQEGRSFLARDAKKFKCFVQGKTRPEAERSIIVVPVKVEGQVIGVISVDQDRANAFDERDLQMIEALALQTATAIQNAGLYEELNALFETSKEIAREQDTEIILRNTVCYATSLLGAKGGGVYVPVRGKDELRLEVVYGLRERLRGTTLEFGEGMAGKVFLEGQPMRLPDPIKGYPDYREWEGRAKAFAPDDFTAVLEVPLKAKDRTLGVLFVVDDIERRAFSERDERLLERFANHASIALQTASRIEELEVLNEIGQAVSAEVSQERLLDRILERANEIIPFESAGIALIDERSNTLELASCFGLPEGVRPKQTRMGEGVTGWVAEYGCSLRVGDVNDIPEIPGVPQQPSYVPLNGDTRSELCVPLRAEGQVIGVLNVESSRVGAFDRRDQDQLEILASQAAIAIENTRTREHSQQQLSALLKVVEAIGAETDPLPVILEETARLFRAEYGSFSLVDANTERLTYCAIWEKDRIVAGEQIPGEQREQSWEKGIVGRVAREGKAFRTGDVAEVRFYSRWYKSTVSELAVPLKGMDGKTLGVLNLESPVRGAFSQVEEDLCQALADVAAAALEKAGLFQELNERAVRLERLQEVTAAISAETSDPKKVLRLIVRRLGDIFKGASCQVRLYNAETDEFTSLAATGVLKDREVEVPRPGGTSRYVIKTKAPRYLAGDELTTPPDGGPPVREEIQKLGIQSVAYSPILSEGNVIGVLYVDLTVPRRFSESDRLILDLFASQAAVAIENARHFRELRERATRLERLQEVTAAISAETSNLDQVLQLIVEKLGGIFQDASCQIRLYDAETDQFTNLVATGVLRNRDEAPRPGGTSRYVAKTKKPRYLVGDELTYPSDRGPAVRDEIQERGIKSVAYLPLLSEGNIIGVLYIDLTSPYRFSESDRLILDLFASQAAVAIENTRHFRELQERAARLERLQEVTAAISAETSDPKKVLRLIVRSLSRIFKDASCQIRLYNAETDEFTSLAATGVLKDREVEIPRPSGTSRYVVTTKAPRYLMGDELTAPSDGGPAVRKEIRELGVKSIAYLPLLSAGNFIGVLYVDLTSPYRFSESDRLILDLFASQAAVAVENARHFKELRERATRLQRLQEVTAAISTETSNLDQVLQLIVEKLGSIFQDASCQIRLYDAETDQFTNLVATGVLRNRDEAPRPGGTSRYVVETRASRYLTGDELTNPSDGGPAVREKILKLGVKSIAYLLLLSEGNVIGVLYVDLTSPYRFSESDRLILELFANQAAVAIENARRREQRLSDITALQEINEAITTQKWEKIAGLVAQKAQELTQAESSTLWLVDEKGNRLVMDAVYGRGTATDQLPDQLPIDQHSINGWVAMTGKPYKCPDVRGDPHYTAWYKDVRSSITVPLKFGGRVIGTLDAESVRPDAFSDDQLRLLQSLANQAAISIEIARLLESAQRRIQDLEIVNEVVRIINEKLDPKHLLDAIVFQIADRLNCARCTIFFPRAEGDKLLSVPETTSCVREEIELLDFKPGEGPVDQVSEKGESLILDDAWRAPRFVSVKEPRDRLPRSMLVVPVKVGDQTIGVISAEQDGFGRFSENDRRLVDALALQAGIAIERAVGLELLRDIGSRIIRVRDVDEVLQQIVTGAIRLTNTTTGVIYLLSEDKRFVIGSFYPPGFDHPEPRMDEKESLTHHVITTGQELCIPDIRKDRRVNPVLRERFQSMIAVPLKIEQDVIGVLYLNDEHPHRFTETEVSLLSTLASQAASAIENARLIQRIQEQREAQTRAIQEIGRSIAAPLELERVLDGILDWTILLMGEASLGEVRLFDRKANMLVVEASRGGFISEKYHEMPLGKGITGWVAQHKQSQLVPDVRKDERYLPFVEDTGSEVTVPMLKGEELIGVLNVEHPKVSAFTESDLKLAEAIAELAVVAIENAELYETLEEKVVERTRQLEREHERRLAAEAWATLGQASGNLAHRINNTTGIIPVAVQSLRELLELENVPIEDGIRVDVTANLDRIERNSRYTLQLAKALWKPFEELPTEQHDLNSLLDEAISVADRPENICLERRYGKELPKVTTSNRLTEAFVELMTNAIRAMPDGGKLTIVSKQTESAYVEVRFSDTGRGIPDENQERIFDLFFTTDESSLGFGLWWIKTFLMSQGGTIAVKSKVGKGTTFTIRLPIKGPATLAG